MGEYVNVLKDYANFKGRARQKEYWLFALIHCIIVGILTVVGRYFDLPFISFKENCTQCNTKCNTISVQTSSQPSEVHKTKPKHHEMPIFKQEKTLEVPNKGYLEGSLNGDEENRILFTMFLVDIFIA